MAEQKPVEIVQAQTKENTPIRLEVFGIDQIVKSRLGREKNKTYPPIKEVKDVTALKRMEDEFAYIYQNIERYKNEPQLASRDLVLVRQQLIDRLKETDGKNIVTELSRSCAEKAVSLSLAQLGAQLKLLESLSHIPPGTNYASHYEATRKGVAEAYQRSHFQKRVEETIIGAEKQSPATAKTLEYMARLSRAKQKATGGTRRFPTGFDTDTVFSVESSLTDWGVNPSLLAEHNSEFKIPDVSGVLNRDASVNYRGVIEFALAATTTPVAHEYAQRPLKYEDIGLIVKNCW